MAKPLLKRHQASRREVLQAAGLAVGAMAISTSRIWTPGAAAADAPSQRYPRKMVSVVSPAYCSIIKGDTIISIVALGLKHATAKCWKQGHGPGADSTLAELSLNQHGEGSFIFHADHCRRRLQ